MNEKWLKMPVDYNSLSFTDFKGLIKKQRQLSRSPNDPNSLSDNTLLSKFKQLMGTKQQQYTNMQRLSTLYENEKKPANTEPDDHDLDHSFDTESMVSSKMENNKPSQDYIRRFWMSDKNSSQCSECGVTFHTFRRKHHCRLCGRVFCQTCCSERININKFKKLKNQYMTKPNNDEEKQEISGLMRVCVCCGPKFKHKTNDPLLGIAVTYNYPNNANMNEYEDECVNNIYDIHIKYVIKQLCRLEKLSEAWEQLIYVFSKRANDTVFHSSMHHIKMNEFIDIRHYIKVKRIQGGAISDCMFVDGVIFRQNVAHRKMRADIMNPNILLLDQAIEYHRMYSKLHSFDILLKQNQEYMRMIVNKIVDLGPDIVIVSNQCSRLAIKEMLLENITLICNVKYSTLKRIAHAIQAPIIGSIDHLNQLESRYALGHCGRFYIKYYNCDPNGSQGRRTPLLFFDKCTANRHSSILLRGDEKSILAKVKNVIRLAMHTLYHLKLEKSFLNNLHLTMNTVNAYKQIQTDNEPHLFLSTSPFIGHSGWRRQDVIAALKRFEANKDLKHPHLQQYPYNHHGFCDNVNEVATIWDPFLPNTDNVWLCQTLLVNHCRVVNQQQCFPPKLKLIDFYTDLDVSLGHYLHRLFRCEACPNARCKELLASHLLTYSHFNKTVTVRFKPLMYEMDEPVDYNTINQIVMWTQCQKCKMTQSQKRIMDHGAFYLSFGKFLEMEFYSNPRAMSINSSCKHGIFDEDVVQCFGFNDMEIQISSLTCEPFNILTSSHIKTNWSLQFKYYINELAILELVSKYAFAAFLAKIDELIGLMNYDIITKDLRKLRQEINDECETMHKQFIEHRDCFEQHFQTNSNPKTISFLNKKRYHLYRISCEWNEVLDGLRGLFAPLNEANVDNTNRWMKKFKAPWKGLTATIKERKLTINIPVSPHVQNRTNTGDENDELLEAALQEIDDKIANVHVAAASSKTCTPSIKTDSESPPSMSNINALTLNFHNLKERNSNFGEMVKGISPRVQNVSFMVDFNAMFAEHVAQNKSDQKLTALKIPPPAPKTDVFEEKKYERYEEISPSISISMADGGVVSPPHAYRSFAFATKHDKNRKMSMPRMERMISANSYLSMSPRTAIPVPNGVHNVSNSNDVYISNKISMTLFPSSSANDKTVHIPDISSIRIPNPTLNDVDMLRLRQESLFLVAACTENSTDIGSNPKYAHLNLAKCFNNQVIPIYIDEPSAIIAYTLSSLEYHCFINNIPTEKVRACRERCDPSVNELEKMVQQRLQKRREKIKIEMLQHLQSVDSIDSNSALSVDETLDLNDLLHHIPKLKHMSKMKYLNEKKEYELQLKKHGMKAFNFKSSKSSKNDNNLQLDMHDHDIDDIDLIKFKFVDPGHLTACSDDEETHTNDSNECVSTTFSCHVYYPYQFRALRNRLNMDWSEHDFIESLSRCQSWNALGGKSGSTFKKTLDDRFVLKFVRQNEFKMFLDNSQSYFEHMAAVYYKNYPSVLVYILGVYQVSWNKSNSAKSNKLYIIVMPNLWYSRNITKQFDLKGSLRGRYIEKGKTKTVMLDKNFIEFMKGFPMPLKDASKQHLHKAIHNDTLFLCRSGVIDYSLLVGLDNDNNNLIVGIIDYLRIYTWDKAVEEHTKTVFGNEKPTIQKPKNYKQRFRQAMERYFMVSPDRKTKRINKPKDISLNQAFKDILI